jgi:hypothetical protein
MVPAVREVDPMTTASLFLADAGATFGGTGDIYRYHLWRRWSLAPKTCLFVMLNPSKATDVIDDPTIRRCMGFARREGCGRLEVCNIFALRSTDPGALYKTESAEGDPENFAHIIRIAIRADLVICGWGSHGKLRSRGYFIKQQFGECGIKSFTLGMTKTGEPGHPLYIRADAALKEFT